MDSQDRLTDVFEETPSRFIPRRNIVRLIDWLMPDLKALNPLRGERVKAGVTRWRLSTAVKLLRWYEAHYPYQVELDEPDLAHVELSRINGQRVLTTEGTIFGPEGNKTVGVFGAPQGRIPATW